MQIGHAEHALHLATPRRVDPARIEHELTAMWAGLDDAAKDRVEDGTTVTRAVMSNLLIHCHGEEEAQRAAEHVPELVELHPARVIVVAAVDGMDGELDAWVSAHCRQVDHQAQLCAEHIEVRFAQAGIARATSLIRSLLIGDLPTALWWFHPEPPTFRPDLFDPLSALAQQVIYDSVGWPQPARGIASMARWVANARDESDKVAYNLAWRRLKPWRRLLAQAMSPLHVPGALAGLREVRLHHGPHHLPVAWLLCAWLGTRLDWRLIDARRHGGPAGAGGNEAMIWRFRAPSGEVQVRIERDAAAPPRIESLELDWHAGGQPGHARFHHAGHLLKLDPARSTLPIMTVPVRALAIETLIAAQLAHRAGDAMFLQAAGLAADMAAALR